MTAPDIVRKAIDCRYTPNDINCTVRIAGSEEEVLRLARRHAIEDHGEEDGSELDSSLRAMMHDELPLPVNSELAGGARLGSSAPPSLHA